MQEKSNQKVFSWILNPLASLFKKSPDGNGFSRSFPNPENIGLSEDPLPDFVDQNFCLTEHSLLSFSI